MLIAQDEPASTLPQAPKFTDKQLKGVDTSTRRELSDEEIQQQFFKNNPGQAQAPVIVFMPFFYERMDKALGKVKTKVTQTSSGMQLEVDAKAMFLLLDELVVSTWLEKLANLRKDCAEAPECMVPFKSFEDPEVKLDFNEGALEMRIHVPPELRSPKTSSFFKAGDSVGDATDRPAFLSSFINFNVNQVFRSDAIELEGGREALNAQMDSGTRIGRVVIDARARYTEHREEIPSKYPEFVRDDVRAIYDFEKSAIRTQVGDLTYPVSGFQVFRPMAGAAFFSQYSLQPSYLTHPSGSYELFLNQPSKVTVYINDRLVQMLNLPAGRHNLRDFPFASGLNDLRIELTDESGRTETKTYTYFSNNTLFMPGLDELSYAVGSPWSDLSGEREYDSGQTTVSGFHRFGVNQHFTVGANIQRDPAQSVFGMDSLLSTKIGYFSFEPAYSTVQGRPSGYAAKLRYIMQNYLGKERFNRFWALEVNGFSEDFMEFGAVREDPYPIALKLIGTHSRAVSKNAALNFNVSYQFNRLPNDELSRSFSLSAGLNKRWNKNLSSTFNMVHQRSPNGGDGMSVMAYLVYSIPDQRQFVTASHDTSTGNSRADWNYQPHSGAGGFGAQANIQEKDDTQSYGALMDYTGNRARMNASHQVAFPKEEEDPNQAVPTSTKSTSITTLHISTALVFAGGHFSLGRPVTDSFVMLVPLENLEGQNVKVNPQTNGAYIAQTDWLGSAVVPELPSYSVSGIALDSKSLTAGAALPRDNFLVKPPYRSGYAIEIGSDATVYLNTKLENEDGTPAAMLAGQAYYLDDSSKEPVTVFTNRSGLLRSEGFRHGRYRLEVVEGGSYEPIEFTIPESAGAEFKMDAVKLKARKP